MDRMDGIETMQREEESEHAKLSISKTLCIERNHSLMCEYDY